MAVATERQEGESLRARAARGTIVSAVWLVALNILSFARGFVVAGFLATSQYGVWGVCMAVLGTVIWLKDVGIGDRFVQQREDDQEEAFQTFFTLELMAALTLTALMLVVMPVYGLALGRTEVIAPGLAIAMTLPAMALQSPIWIFYREMDYVRQRTLQSIDPVIGFVVTVSLAASGAGVWALVAGSLAGAWSQVLVVLRACPYKIRLRRTPGALRDYVAFSWPLVVASGSGLAIAQATIFVGEAAVGLAGLGAITLANNLTRYTGQVDQIVTETLYPAICRAADRPALLWESFLKSNRLALMWGVPFGIGVTLFADDLVHYVIGERWHPAVVLLQALGVVTAISQVGFNWTAYFRATGNTRPFATVAVITSVSFLVTAIPLLFVDGLRGLAIGSLVFATVGVGARVRYLRELFPRFSFWRQAARGAAPVLPAAAVVLIARAAHDGGAVQAAAEVVVYCVLVIGATAWFERRLLREVLGYVRGRTAAA